MRGDPVGEQRGEASPAARDRAPGIVLEVRGSGPIACAFVLFALRQGVPARSIVFDRDRQALPPALAGRVLALSLGSWQLLGRVARIARAAPIGAVRVRVAGHPGRTTMTAAELRVPALGYTVRYAALLAALDEALDQALDPRAGAATRDATGNAIVDPTDAGAPCVVVHAEGDTGDDARTRDFAQSALLADLRCERDSAGTAFECFTGHGPLALLPLPEARSMSLVWCAPPRECERRAELEPAALAAELREAFGGELGAFSIVGSPAIAPLARRARRVLARDAQVWIGNAAQALHPVAGQGLNLGLRDAFELSRVVGEVARDGSDASQALRGYARTRMLDRGVTIGVTDALAALFTASPLRGLQSVALAALDLAPRTRARLARGFMFGAR